MKKKIFWCSLILTFVFYVLSFNGQKIDHLVVREKIDRVGNLQNGGEGEVHGLPQKWQ